MKSAMAIAKAGASATALAVLLFLVNPAHAAPEAGDGATACPEAGAWIVPATGETIAADAVMAMHASRPIVLLGETHGRADQHRWQLHTMAALYGYRPDMVVGVEMLPRRVQPILDRWVRGEMTDAAFLQAVDWNTVWGFDPELYLPLFHFARLHRVPMVALNVDRTLIARIGQEGWDAIPEEDREGVSTPEAASEAYRRSLAEIYALKQHMRQDGEQPDATPAAEADVQEILRAPDFQHFVEAQLAWDRAMGEGLAREARRSDRPLVVGIIGRGHLENRWGVPHQLASLGLPDAAVLLPWRREQCAEITPGIADTVFLVNEDDSVADRQGPRLGVMVAPHRDGVEIIQIAAGSIADSAGLAEKDVILSIGGDRVRTVQDVVAIVRKQAPGASLPVIYRRGAETREVVARFPDPPPDSQ